MSDSDDTDILLLIPPDLFNVASSQDSLVQCYPTKNNSIVNELLGHVQSLDDRISAIESRDNSLNPSLLDGTFSESRIDANDNHPDLFLEHLETTRSIINQSSALCQRKNCVKLQSFGETLSSSPTQCKNINFKQNEIATAPSNFPTAPMNTNMAFTTVNYPITTTANTHQCNSDSLNISQQLMNFNYNSRDSNGASKEILNDANRLLANEIADDKKTIKFDKKYPISEMSELLSVHGDVSPYKCIKNYGVSLSGNDRKSLDQLTPLNLTSTPKKNYNTHDSALRKTDREENTINSQDFKANVTLKSFEKINEPPLNTEYQTWQSQRLISLSDFWLPDSNKSEEELMRIKLEEEKFRREHCEQLIQELQKRLLEQQEKVAVAIRVDKEKSDIILQFQTIWSKFKERWNAMEADHNKLQSTLETIKMKNEEEINNLQLKIKDKDNELSKIINLMSECEEKRDAAIKEKRLLLEDHVNELEKYKLLVHTADNRYETLKSDFDKLNERNQQLEQVNKNYQQELHKERLKSSEVRSEMTVIHKALDTCEAELIILRQEKENLLLKLKEEENRIGILEKNKMMLLEELNNAKKSESLVREEMKSLLSQQEVKRSELRDIYQNQVDEVVNIKLKEFQSQLDAAELTFQMELDAKQRAIAECAARKIKNIIDKHQLEINLLEEKHREEKRLCDIRLSQTAKKAMALEAQLNTQQNAKSRLADQLHTLMEKQYQQALQIITTENITTSYQSSQRLNGDKLIDINNGANKSDDFTGVSYSEPVKLQAFKTDRKQLEGVTGSGQNYEESLMTFMSGDESPNNKIIDSNDDLKKYIKMILQMQESKKKIVQSKNTENNNSNSSIEVCREVPRKFYLKAEMPNDSSSDIKCLSQNETEEERNSKTNTNVIPCHENQYLPIRTIAQMEKQKPPWK